MCILSSCFPCVHGRSRHSTQLYQIPSATSAVEVGKLVRNPGAVCVCGLYPCRARYRLYIQGSTYLVLGISGNVIMLLYAQIENFLTLEVIRVY